MLRHSAFFMFRQETTLEQAVEMLKGLAYMRFACPSVRALDFGLDEFGGSAPLREVKPWDRQPRWRSRKLGPPVSYDIALHLDFDDQAGMDDYNDDDVHHEVAVYNASICRGEETARVDWWYDGAPLITKNQYKHAAMFLWSDESDESDRESALDAVKSLGDLPEVQHVVIGKNIGTLKTDFDGMLDIRCADRASVEKLLAGEEYAQAMKQLGDVTQYEWTARVTHLMHGL